GLGRAFMDGNPIPKPEDLEGMFYMKLDTDGELVWLRTAQSGMRAYCQFIRGSGKDIYFVGHFTDTLIVDDIRYDAVEKGGEWGDDDIFILKTDTAGITAWVRTFGSKLVDYPTAFTLDAAGNVWFATSFRGTINIGWDKHTTSGAKDALVVKLTPWGEVVGVSRTVAAHPLSSAEITGLKITESGEIMAAGWFQAYTYFGDSLYTSYNYYDGFVWFTGLQSLGIEQENKEENGGMTVYPNPATGALTLQLPGKDDRISAIAMTDLAGKMVFNITVPTTPRQAIDIRHLPGGIYILSVTTGSRVYYDKVIIQR
ncbi:MAG: T9SS type A sorting domain-containing protein, partial [Bacteroidota bacterium]|nr:T9SS type A sorting domain-containing protein [Bacteroidota bacterium]